MNSGPSNQTDLKECRRYNLGDDAEPTFKGGADRWAHGARQPIGGAGQPHMAATYPLLRWFVFWSLLESSHVGLLWINVICFDE